MREALKLALEAFDDRSSLMKWQEARDAVKEALAQTKQEPVAWIEGDEPILTWVKTDPKAIPLYTTPPQRTWVGLTPEEVDSLANLKVDGAYLSVPDTIRQTDAKLKEKNT